MWQSLESDAEGLLGRARRGSAGEVKELGSCGCRSIRAQLVVCGTTELKLEPSVMYAGKRVRGMWDTSLGDMCAAAHADKSGTNALLATRVVCTGSPFRPWALESEATGDDRQMEIIK
ncbi:hypothetical protein PLESTB_000985400 [Pleodorina starrii]|uniref:Uncharacterized protein n=1 Tax=Pleodorina starrii TaxID=330485 RepID=A0A9W6BP50_9CHLO|nr:hypothetical protein PLESTM_000547900 [Pleodorina starrii]GLC55420.1 hypothetical protein PLESTB_000985400 [Pleodorina starrii]